MKLSFFTSRYTVTGALALGAGIVNVFAFAPFGWWPVQIASLALIFWLVQRANGAKHATLIGWAYGTGWVATCTYWLFVSMHVYGGMPSWMAATAVVLLAAALSLLYGAALGASRLAALQMHTRPRLLALVALPALFTLAELARGWIFTGFPWASSGYAHTHSPLAGFAPLVGVYGIGFLAAMIAGGLSLLPRWLYALTPACAILLLGWVLKPIAWTQAHGEPITVRLLQGNVPQDLKFREITQTLSLYNAMITAEPADLIATPETALPIFASQLPPGYLDNLSDFAQQTDSHIALGIPIRDETGYANGVLGIAPTAGAPAYRYDKHHLVPFGEFIPPGARWFVQMMQIPLGDFARGQLTQAPFAVRDQWVLPNICYEDLFGEEIAAQLRTSHAAGTPMATVLLNMTNIAWFGDTIAVPQHLQISQMRARELGRPMLRATNTGATAVVLPDATVDALLPAYEQDALRAQVQGYTGLTPYAALGNRPVFLVSILLIAAAFLLALMRRNPVPAAGKSS